jgi:hypothetical protein
LTSKYWCISEGTIFPEGRDGKYGFLTKILIPGLVGPLGEDEFLARTKSWLSMAIRQLLYKESYEQLLQRLPQTNSPT